MNPQRKPFNLVNLHGEGCFGSVTLARPTAQELRFLPAGALGRALGALTGRRDAPPDGHNYGPCYYMPRLFLDSALATLGGLLFWGYAKKLARFTVGADRFAIQGENGAPQVSLGVKAMGEPQPVAARPQISAVQAMLAQPLVSQRPAALGPILVVADFDKQWDRARLRPRATQVQVQAEFVPGFSPGSHPAQGASAGIAACVLGSYELNAPWRLGMPHAPVLRR